MKSSTLFSGSTLNFTIPELHKLQELIASSRKLPGEGAALLGAWLIDQKWAGSFSLLISKLPMPGEPVTLQQLRITLSKLGWDSRPIKTNNLGLDNSHPPILIRTKAGQLAFVVEINGTNCIILDENGQRSLQPKIDVAEAWQLTESNPDSPIPGWTQKTIGRFKAGLYSLVLASLLANMAALAIPFFTMAIYDRVIPSYSQHSLVTILTGAILMLVTMFGLRASRQALLMAISDKLDAYISTKTINRLLNLPALVSSHFNTDYTSRIDDANRMKDMASWNFAPAVLDLPFVVLFLAAIAYIGGSLVLVPLISIALLFAAAPLASQLFEREMSDAQASLKKSRNQQKAGLQYLTNLKALGMLSMQYQKIMESVVDQASSARVHMSTLGVRQAIIQAGARLLALFTLCAGLVMVFDNKMTQGELIAVMMLIWRLISPVQSGLTAMARWKALKRSITQIDRLMMVGIDKDDTRQHSAVPNTSPCLQMENVSVRYRSDCDLSLSGVSCLIPEGQLTVVIGPNGCGKSTLLRCLAGIVSAQNGKVMLDGHNISQFDHDSYRDFVRATAHKPLIMPLTVLENFKLGNPRLTEEEVWQWLERFHCKELFEDLEQGLHTEIENENSLPSEMTRTISLIRCLATGAPIMLFDEPLAGPLNQGMADAFQQWLEEQKGKRTVVVSTHRSELIKTSDHVVVLNNGGVYYTGPNNKNGSSQKSALAPQQHPTSGVAI